MTHLFTGCLHWNHGPGGGVGHISACRRGTTRYREACKKNSACYWPLESRYAEPPIWLYRSCRVTESHSRSAAFGRAGRLCRRFAPPLRVVAAPPPPARDAVVEASLSSSSPRRPRRASCRRVVVAAAAASASSDSSPIDDVSH